VSALGIATAAAVRIGLARLLRPHALVVAGVAAVVGYLTVVPLAYLAWRTFTPGGSLSLDAFRDAYAAFGLGSMVANSLAFALLSTVLAVACGTLLAYLVVRTDLGGKTVIFVLAVAPLVIPIVLYTIAWIFLASPRSGALNAILGPGTLNVFTLWGMAVIQGLHLAPLVFLLMFAAFRRMDPALEESAFTSGAGLATVFRRVTLRLAVPALSAAVLITGVQAIESFEVPALVGVPGDVWVLTSRIWNSVSRYPFDLAEAGAWSLTLLALVSAGVFAHPRLARRARRFETVTGKGFRPHALPLGGWRWPAIAFVAAWGVVAVALPLLILVYASLQPFYAPPSFERIGNSTLEHFGDLFTDGDTLHALKNSAVLAVGAASAVMLAMAVASWVALRTGVRGRWLVDNLAFLPIAVPGLILGVALLFIYLRLPLGVYGTLWILFIAYFTRYMPYGIRYASVSMAQVGRDLEECSYTSGAGWWHTFRRILLPLVAPGLVAGWITIVVFALRELSSSLVLYSPGREVLAIEIWQQYENGDFPQLAALGVVMVAGLGVLVAIAHRLGARMGVEG
jgi:iron(III) transport system permease protein